MLTHSTQAVRITMGGAILDADLDLPPKPLGVVILPHGSGTSRLTPRNRHIARRLNELRFASLTCDLLTTEESVAGDLTGAYRTDAGLLGERLTEFVDWIIRHPQLRSLPIVMFASGSAAPAAVMAAAQRPNLVSALAIRGARLDAAYTSLGWLRAPTLLIAAQKDVGLVSHYEAVLEWIAARDRELVVIPRASSTFQEPHTIDDAVEYAAHFFANHLGVAPQIGLCAP
jgi:putative phosphoribosyl transferase